MSAPEPVQKVSHWAGVAALGAGVAWIGQGYDVPLPWLLGPLLVAAIISAIGYAPPDSDRARRLAQAIIGIAIGHSFSAGMLPTVISLIPFMIFMAVWSVVVAAFCSLLLVRFTQLDRTSALLANMPGGLAEMAFLAQEMGRKTAPAIVTIQTVRLTSMVIIIPVVMSLLMDSTGSATPLGQGGGATVGLETAVMLAVALAAGWVLERIGVKNAYIIGAIIVSLIDTITGVLHATVPGIFIIAAQIVLGLAIGSRFRREDIARLPRIAFIGLLVSLLTSIVTLASVLVVSLFIDVDVYTLALAGAPAGIAEMVLTASALGLSVPLVACFQLTRIFVVNAFAAPIAALWERLGGQERKND